MIFSLVEFQRAVGISRDVHLASLPILSSSSSVCDRGERRILSSAEEAISNLRPIYTRATCKSIQPVCCQSETAFADCRCLGGDSHHARSCRNYCDNSDRILESAIMFWYELAARKGVLQIFRKLTGCSSALLDPGAESCP